MSNLTNIRKGFWIPLNTFVILVVISLVVLLSVVYYLFNSQISSDAKQELSEQKSQKVFVQSTDFSEEERRAIDVWLEKENLNQYGDHRGTTYETDPLYNKNTAERIDRYYFLKNKFPFEPWKSLMSK